MSGFQGLCLLGKHVIVWYALLQCSCCSVPRPCTFVNDADGFVPSTAGRQWMRPVPHVTAAMRMDRSESGGLFQWDTNTATRQDSKSEISCNESMSDAIVTTRKRRNKGNPSRLPPSDWLPHDHDNLPHHRRRFRHRCTKRRDMNHSRDNVRNCRRQCVPAFVGSRELSERVSLQEPH